MFSIDFLLKLKKTFCKNSRMFCDLFLFLKSSIHFLEKGDVGYKKLSFIIEYV